MSDNRILRGVKTRVRFPPELLLMSQSLVRLSTQTAVVVVVVHPVDCIWGRSAFWDPNSGGLEV